MRCSLRSLAVLVPLLVVAGAARADGPRTESLADGVFAVLQPDDLRFNDSNSLVADLGDGLLVVDVQATLASTGRTIAAIRERSSKPVRYLVLTHWHGDHVQGIPAYRRAWPGLEVIAHESVAEDIRDRAEPALLEEIERYRDGIASAREKLAAGVGLDDRPLDAAGRTDLADRIERTEAGLADREALPRPLAGPDLTFAEAMTLRGARRTAELLHVRAHTRGDTIVHLPDDGVLATGDVVDDLPYGGHGYPTSWIAAMRRLADLPFDVLVPGHGSLRRGGGHLDLVREMTESLVAQVEASVQAGGDLDTTLAALDLETFRSRLVADDERAGRAWDAFIPATVERAWLEARGELRD